MKVEEHFQLEIPDEVASRLVTVGQLHHHVYEKLSRRGSKVGYNQVFDELRDLICEQIGVKPHQVVAEAEFVKDLRID